ncbi:MAG: hypothetical protein EOP06_23925, partial [Proteobacteria bacterium]
MAKRFFDTKLHKKPWFRTLRFPVREAFRIHCAECDEIGIWEIDMDALNFSINLSPHDEPVTVEELVEAFDFRIVEGDKLWNPSAVAFQFGDESGEISPGNKLLPKVTRMLKARGLPPPKIKKIDPPSKPHPSPIDGVKEQEEEEEQEQEEEKEIKTGDFNPLELATLWNKRMAGVKSHEGSAMPLVGLSRFKPGSDRWNLAAERIANDPDPKVWIDVIDRIARSQFCRGYKSKNGWIASFDFLIKPKTIGAVLEGVTLEDFRPGVDRVSGERG